jgi:glycerol kinase
MSCDDGYRMIESTNIENLTTKKVEDNGGVYFVPALTGLGSSALGSSMLEVLF